MQDKWEIDKTMDGKKKYSWATIKGPDVCFKCFLFWYHLPKKSQKNEIVGDMLHSLWSYPWRVGVKNQAFSTCWRD